MTITEKIAASVARPYIDELILLSEPSSTIAQKVAAKSGILFDPAAIETYRQELSKGGNSPLQQVVRVTQDLANNDLPPTDEFGKLSMNFSFKKTNDDLDLIYERIKDLRKFATANPEDGSYDRRIKEYLAQAESIRTRVYTHQYEQIRQAILLTTGKKICTAAISILMPYIPKMMKEEAMRRFQAAIEPLLDLRSLPDMPLEAEDLQSPAR